MNFDDAVAAHSAWKRRLLSYSQKPDGSLKIAEVQQDNRCDLGRWIYGEGAKYSKMPEYETLRKQHAEFHKAAAAVVSSIHSGTFKSEDTSLGGSSAFSRCSSACVSAIMTMKRKAGG